MPVTATSTATVQSALNNANPNNFPDACHEAGIGSALSPIKVTFTGLTSSATQDITTAAARAAATIVGFSPALPTLTRLPAIGHIATLRVTAGAAAAGARIVQDAAGAAAATIANVSDDGKTLVFEAAVTAFVLTYFPRATSLLAAYPLSAP